MGQRIQPRRPDRLFESFRPPFFVNWREKPGLEAQVEFLFGSFRFHVRRCRIHIPFRIAALRNLASS